MHEIQSLGNRLKLERPITLKKSKPARAQSKNAFQPAAKFFTLVRQRIDPERTMQGNGYDNCYRERPGVALACLRYYGREPHLFVRDNHGKNQQHEQNINQWNHIDF